MDMSDDTDATDNIAAADAAEGDEDPPFVKKFEEMDRMEAEAKKQAQAKKAAKPHKETISKRQKQLAKAVKEDLEEPEDAGEAE